MNYGTRWEKEPAALTPSIPSSLDNQSTDYIDVFFERALIVIGVQIFETYFPGAVVAIRACYRDQPSHQPLNARGLYWVTLWKSGSDHDQLTTSNAVTGDNALLPAYKHEGVPLIEGSARVFEPVLVSLQLDEFLDTFSEIYSLLYIFHHLLLFIVPTIERKLSEQCFRRFLIGFHNLTIKRGSQQV